MKHKSHILKRAGTYYFNRRVPCKYALLDPRGLIRRSLETDSLSIANQKAFELNSQLENYWHQLSVVGNSHNLEAYQETVNLARTIGFKYQPISELIKVDLPHLLSRLNSAEVASLGNEPHVKATLGTGEVPTLTLSQGLEKYWALTKEKIMRKNPNKVRKWKNPRIKAVKNLKLVLGEDKDITCLTRDDILRLKDWWIEKIKANNMAKSSANKDFVHLKDLLTVLRDNLKLDLDLVHLFNGVLFRQEKRKNRLPFTTDYILSTLLNPKTLDKCRLNDEERAFIFAFAETGARPVELLMLTKNTIFLDTAIPFIRITPDETDDLKTVQSERDIPLVGFALEAFQKFPNGFTQWFKNSDGLSTRLNKTLRENGFMPSAKHSMYSLRHSFSDRLIEANAGDKIHTQLMGHEFDRPDYGLGANLEKKLEYLKKIQLSSAT